MQVSVVIPCYNSERYILACIKSVLLQKQKPSEIIIVDDGSRDRTLKVVNESIKKYKLIRVVQHKTNKGLAEARNTGLLVANGEIVVFIDSDCLMDPNLLKYVTEDFSDPQIVGVGGQEVVKTPRTIYDKYRKTFPQSWGENKIVNPPFLWGLCFSFRRNILLKSGLFSSMFKTNGEDVDISLRLMKMGYKLLYDPRIKVNHIRIDNLISLLKREYYANYFGRIAHLKNSTDAKFKGISIKFMLKLLREKFINPIVRCDLGTVEKIFIATLRCMCLLIGIIAIFKAYRDYYSQRLIN